MWQNPFLFQYEHDHEIAALKNALPGEGDPNAAGVAQSSDKMLSVQKNNENRSLKTNRLFPTPNKPDPMPQNLAFLFTKITPDRGAASDHSLSWFHVHKGGANVQKAAEFVSKTSGAGANDLYELCHGWVAFYILMTT